MRRWRLLFASPDRSLTLQQPPAPIDGFAVGERWNRNDVAYSASPRGNPVVLARQAPTPVEALP